MLMKAVDWNMVEEETGVRHKVKLKGGAVSRLRYSFRRRVRETAFQLHGAPKPIVTMALHTGMRTGEILSPEMDNADMKIGSSS
jgi:hypothetical protein